jgi:hypothetical protein
VRRALILLAIFGCGTRVLDLDRADGPVEKIYPPCVTKLSGESRRVLCGPPAYAEERAVLKCVVVPGSTCGMCYWSDGEGKVCKECVDANGTTDTTDCDRLRTDLK